ncbi:MAG: SGNH/GDSL hydrolase family protein [Desulfobacterales bacterium]|nr:MAG: SGNH/GDSL hydrolase family protein [Desulfobacterales bacterium]
MQESIIKSKYKSFKYYTIGCVVIITALFGTLELSTRLISWIAGKGFTLSLHEYDPLDKDVTGIYQWHPFTGITFKPKVVFTGSHPQQKSKAIIYVDQHGFLTDGNILSCEKSADEIRIAFIGASTTATINLSFKENWPGYLGRLLENELPDKKVTIINAAVPGFNTAHSIANLALRVIPFEPDIVIIYHLYNNLTAIKKNETFKPDYSHIHRKPFGFYQQPNVVVRWLNHSMIFVRLRNRLREIKKEKLKIEKRKEILQQADRLAEIPDQAIKTFEQHLRSLVSIAEAGGAKVILSSFATLHNPKLDYSNKDVIPQLSKLQKEEIFKVLNFTPGLTLEAIFEGIDRYNEVIKKIAVEKKTGWVDNAAMIPNKDRYFVDRVHFSRAGAALMAKNFLPTILKILKQKKI